MAAVKAGQIQSVNTLLKFGIDCLECPDALGMSPFAAAVYFKRDAIMALLIRYKANMYFRVNPVKTYSDRANLINKYLLLHEEKQWKLRPLLSGAGFVHIASLRPSCFASSLLVILTKYMKNHFPMSLDDIDSYGRSPLYYALCHPFADNLYQTLLSFKSPRAHRMAMFLILAAAGQASELSLSELNLCGNEIDLYTTISISSEFCNMSPEKFPKLRDMQLKNSSSALMRLFATTGNDVRKVAVSKIKQPNTLFIFMANTQISQNTQELIQSGISIFGYDSDVYRQAVEFPNESSVITKQ